MKKLLLLSLICIGFIMTDAQSTLSDGSVGPDFTLYEIDKERGTIISTNPYTLYEYTDAGKAVYLDIFAVWCSPCWNYHTAGHLESLYGQYGPEGTNEVMVFAIEGDEGNYSTLSGGTGSQGNWLNGVEYPVIPTNMSPNSLSAIGAYYTGYFPTIYMVCPNRVVFEVGQQSTAGLYASKTQLCPQFDATLANNGMLLKLSNIENSYYCNMTTTPKVILQNIGNEALTSAVLNINFDGQISTFSWNGNLAKYATQEVSLPQISTDVDGMHSYSVELATVNGVNDADTSWNISEVSFLVSSNATTEDVEQDFTDLSYPWNLDDDTYFGIHTNQALFFDGYHADQGVTGCLYSPLMDISRFQVPTLKFDVAHRRYGSYNERLQVQSSVNCGSNWIMLYNKAGAALATVTGSTSSAFVPTATQWRTEVVDLSNLADKTQVALRFKFISGYGNYVWLDNIRIVEGLGVEDVESEALSIYPNPVSDVIFVNAPESVSEVLIYNLQGQLVRSLKGDIHEVSVADLADGVYMMKVRTESGSVSTQKIVKQ